MNSKQIEKLVLKDFYVKNKFIGVIPLNYLKNLNPRKNDCFILWDCKINEKKVCHFIAMIFLKNKIIYFDPLGFFPQKHEVKLFLKKHKLFLEINDIQIQDFLSIKCGKFCVAFLLFYYRYKNLKSFQSLFENNNLLKNDQIVEKIIKILSSM